MLKMEFNPMEDSVMSVRSVKRVECLKPGGEVKFVGNVPNVTFSINL